jgi:tetratricopeptide (TPR) repeat protein
MSLGVAGFGIIGALCKDPAIMMVCYILVIEFTLVPKSHLSKPPFWNIWRAAFLILPLIAVWIYFLYDIQHMNQLYVKREFNMGERLFTESRVLMDYLRVILFPSMSGTGPYHDDYVISRGLLQPASTVFSIVFIVASLALAVKYRHKYPLASMAVLWFFMAHMLESTILPLELYFEHRNYLPMLGMIFAASHWIVHHSGKIKKWAHVGVILFIGLEAGITYASSQVWGNSALIANVWAHEHPRSIRAQIDAIRFWLHQKDFNRVEEHFVIAIRHNPDDAGIHLYKYIVDQCNTEKMVQLGSSLEEILTLIPTARFEHASLEGIKFLIENKKSGRCRTDNETITKIIDAYLSNDKFFQVDSARGVLYKLASQVYIDMGDLDKTIESLDKAYEATPRYGFALNQAYLLYTANLYDDAFRYIEKAKNTKPHNPYVGMWKDRHIAEIETALRQSIEAQTRH